MCLSERLICIAKAYLYVAPARLVCRADGAKLCDLGIQKRSPSFLPPAVISLSVSVLAEQCATFRCPSSSQVTSGLQRRPLLAVHIVFASHGHCCLRFGLAVINVEDLCLPLLTWYRGIVAIKHTARSSYHRLSNSRCSERAQEQRSWHSRQELCDDRRRGHCSLPAGSLIKAYIRKQGRSRCHRYTLKLQHECNLSALVACFVVVKEAGCSRGAGKNDIFYFES